MVKLHRLKKVTLPKVELFTQNTKKVRRNALLNNVTIKRTYKKREAKAREVVDLETY